MKSEARSYRFRVTTGGDPPKTLFVYGRSEAAARALLPKDLPVARFEAAGHTERGVIVFPPDELRAVMSSMQDGRRAPGA